MMYLFVMFTFLIGSVASKYCYWNTGCPYKFLSYKTPYDLVRGDIRDSVLRISGCEPVSIWSQFRHGQKYPSKIFGLRMKDTYSKKENLLSAIQNGKNVICGQDAQNLREWTWDDSVITKADELKPEGYQETLEVAKRLKDVFPEILSSLGPDSYLIRPTAWNIKTAHALIEGITGSSLKLDVAPSLDEPHWTCKKYFNEVTHNANTYTEIYNYYNSTEFSAVNESVLTRLGIQHSLTMVNITSLYDLCRNFWSNSENKPSAWCAVFSTEDLRIMEYIGDLQTYYESGYGDWRNAQFGKKILSDMYENFEKVKNGTGKKLIAYLVDKSSTSMTITALGLFQDGHPLPGDRRVLDRKWRSSTIAPFGANLLAVLHRCSQDKENDYKIVFYLNEERLNLCSNGWCTWDEFQTKFQAFTSTNLDFCDLIEN